MEKKNHSQTLIGYIEAIYPEKQKDGHFIKTLHFNFPIRYKGEEMWSFFPLNETTVECVPLLSNAERTTK